MRVAGKDELFEALGALLNRADQALSRKTILSALREREHLGATGIGLGVAVPHGRVPGLVRCVGVFLTLAQPMDYHAIDGKPVTMVFALLVPEQAVQDADPVPAGRDIPQFRNEARAACGANHGRDLPVLRPR